MSYSIPKLKSDGTTNGTFDLNADLFNAEMINETLMHEYVIMYLANQRQSGAHTKTRGEVKRSGRKLFRQKGTGRARVGDAGSPIRRSGGVAMGPRNDKDYSKAMPQKMRRKALLGSLTTKADTNTFHLIEKITFDSPSTKTAAAVLKNANNNEKTLFVVGDESHEVTRSFANLDRVTTVSAKQLNAYAVLTHKHIVFTDSAMKTFEDHFSA